MLAGGCKGKGEVVYCGVKIYGVHTNSLMLNTLTEEFTMSTYQERVIEEKRELDEKRQKLLEFFNTDIFRGLTQAEKDRLRTQHSVMGVYSEILHQRISAFS